MGGTEAATVPIGENDELKYFTKKAKVTVRVLKEIGREILEEEEPEEEIEEDTYMAMRKKLILNIR